MENWLVIILFLIIAPVGTIMHEVGHILAASAVKADRLELSIGRGKQVKKLNVGKIKLTVHLFIFMGGYSKGERYLDFNQTEKVFIALCGPLANVIVANLTHILSEEPNSLITLFVLYNWWLAIVNLIPFTYNGMHSDGYSIIKTFFIKDNANKS